MTALAERFAALKRRGELHLVADEIPYARFLGLGFEEREGALVGRLSYSDMLVGNPALPALHGGTIGALLESTAIVQLAWTQELAALPKTINLTVDYLRSAGPVDTWARGIITRVGRRVATVRAEAWQESPEAPVAVATAHFLVEPR